jgi:hypothetical protein
MTARLASAVLVGALIRKAESEGGNAAVLAKGDPTAGTIVVLLTERGGNAKLFERILQVDGNYSWVQATVNIEEIEDTVVRKRRFDPDLWLLELDIPSGERFAAEMNSLG